MSTYISNSFANQLMLFFSKMVIKNESMAERFETPTSKKQARRYIAAIEKTDSFLLYEDLYTIEDLVAVGLTTDDAVFYIKNLLTLPEEIKEKLVVLKRKYVIDNYEETNMYYRMLNGEPPIGFSPYVIKGRDVTTFNVEETAYIYKDELDKIRKIHSKPEDRYLYHLGENKVDYYTARTTPNLRPLYYHNYTFDQYLTRKIIDTYYETASYIQSVFYTKSFEGYERYTNFLIVVIIFNTINRILSEPIRMAIRGEFTDIEALRDLFATYNLPFDPLISKRYLQRIVKNLNNLFAYKGTNQVLIDIVSLFGYDKIILNKYYLTKDMKKDENGNFIFKGEEHERFELNFLEVPIADSERNSLFTGEREKIDYDILTQDDPFWGGNEKEKTKQKILETDFNYLNTKYLSINTMTNIAQIIQEMCYFFNFINDAQSEGYLEQLEMVNTEIKESSLPFKLFDLVVAIQILISKKLGYDDLIIYSSTAISSLYGFNFKSNEKELAAILDKYPDSPLKEKYGKILSNDIITGRYQKKDLIRIYFENLDYKTDLEKLLSTVSDINDYRMLKEIYNYNCYSTATRSMFKKNDGSYYETYSEYLKDSDLELYNFTEKYIKDDDHLSALQMLFDSADLYLEDVRFTSMFLNSAVSDRLRNYIYSLLCYFKAYTVDIKNFNVFFLMDDKTANMVKLIDTIEFMEINTDRADRTFDGYYERLLKYKEHLVKEDLDLLKDYALLIYKFILEDSLDNYDEYYEFLTATISDRHKLVDTIYKKIKNKEEFINFTEKRLIIKYEEDYIFNKVEPLFKDFILHVLTRYHVEDTNLNDSITEKKYIISDSIEFSDSFLNMNKQENINNF